MKKHIVVGAGIAGASAAYHLARFGEHVTVVDRADSGQATDAAAGIICPWISQRRNKAWYALAKAGAAYYQTLIRMLKEDGETETGYSRRGAISLHTDEEKLKAMKERALKRREDAPEIGEVYLLSQEDTKKLFPLVSEEFQSLYVSGAARVNGRALRDALMSAARRYGAEVKKGSALLLHQEKRVNGVSIDGSIYPADSVIVTAGAWADQLLLPLGLRLQLSAQKAQILHLQLPDNPETGCWPVVIPPNNQYMVPFQDGKMIIGATHEDHKAFDQRVTAGGIYEILHKGLAAAPGLAEAEMIEARVGYRPHTPGFLPIIGEVPGYKGILIANGLGASGLTAGPFLGAQLASLARGVSVDFDLSPYSPQGAFTEDVKAENS
ncbi:FAD-dependent oxidoreductase [Bacillus lacus]|uniref:FAD-dependent oxidoreductase n=1 Tax=Metabacillus lacus TaxID=1983721 RepID=A0A7X2LW86_9BACI|nr:FAD-dependent oxidoreductase [Metabacillus lacus]MRX71210.1 FAD-dependent oxidoreductase [Metabacillus lacus]